MVPVVIALLLVWTAGVLLVVGLCWAARRGDDLEVVTTDLAGGGMDRAPVREALSA